MTSSLSLHSSFVPSFADLSDRGLISKNSPTSVSISKVPTWKKKQISNRNSFKLNCVMEKSAGSVFSFITGSVALSKHLVETTKYFSIAVSFGSVKSLISMPCFMSHASIPAEVREARGLTEDLVRISAGIEDVDDLISDLDIAFKTFPL
uniref:Cystathionine beta-lyase n=1 Tax=Arabidopsis thaliana TaxID=3702 RepID=Q8LAA9_ARATH|nr:unknown [Arabidopsis thaliana]